GRRVHGGPLRARNPREPRDARRGHPLGGRRRLTLVSGPSITFREVGLELAGTRILHDVDFAVEAGSVHCIIGPNGGGKTSLIRCLLGQMPHTGTISIEWRGGATTIGYVPQLLDFDRTLPVTVEDF